jgi:hypothetical protein
MLFVMQPQSLIRHFVHCEKLNRKITVKRAIGYGQSSAEGDGSDVVAGKGF